MLLVKFKSLISSVHGAGSSQLGGISELTETNSHLFAVSWLANSPKLSGRVISSTSFMFSHKAKWVRHHGPMILKGNGHFPPHNSQQQLVFGAVLFSQCPWPTSMTLFHIAPIKNHIKGLLFLFFNSN